MDKNYDHYEIEQPEEGILYDPFAKINAEIVEGILAQGLPLADDPEREDENQAQLFDTLDSLLIHVSSKEQIAEIVKDDSVEKSATVELYTQEVIQKVFALIAGYVQANEDITLALKFCFERIISKESRLYVLEKMRQLIQREKDESIKRKLFESFVKSIEGSENHPFGVLLEDDNYAEIHQELVELSSDPDRKKSITASMMLDMIETNLLVDNDSWNEISLCIDFKQFAEEICNRHENQFKSIDPAITRAWENILYPRLFVLGNLIYSESLLLH